MELTSARLSDLVGAKIYLLDRTALRFEDKCQLIPKFSRKELLSRKLDISRQLGTDGPTFFNSRDANEAAALPHAWMLHLDNEMSSKPGWHSQTLDAGEDLFGDAFERARKLHGSFDSKAAVVAPVSCYFDYTEYFAEALGMNVYPEAFEGLDDLMVLHELGHARFSYSEHDLRSPFKAAMNEALADGFAVKTYLNLGGSTKAVQTFVNMRRLFAFLGQAPMSYATASYCEAVRDHGQSFPSLTTNFERTRGLQLRVLDVLLGTGDEGFYSSDDRVTLARYRSNEFLNHREAANPKSIISPLSFGCIEEVIAVLGSVLRSQTLSEGARTEGKKVKEAYDFFGRDRSVALRPHENAAKPLTTHDFY